MTVDEIRQRQDWNEFQDHINAERKDSTSELTDEQLIELYEKWLENTASVKKVNLDKPDETVQESGAQTAENDFGIVWQDGYAQDNETDFGGIWQDGYGQAGETVYGDDLQDGFDEPTETAQHTESSVSVDNAPAEDMDTSTDIIDLNSPKAIENAQPSVEEQQSGVSEEVQDTDSLFYKIDDLGDEHTDDSFSQSVKLHNEIKRLERELASANAKISSMQGIIDKTNAVINSDKQLLSHFRAAMKKSDKTVDKEEKEKTPDQPKPANPSKHNRK